MGVLVASLIIGGAIILGAFILRKGQQQADVTRATEPTKKSEVPTVTVNGNKQQTESQKNLRELVGTKWKTDTTELRFAAGGRCTHVIPGVGGGTALAQGTWSANEEGARLDFPHQTVAGGALVLESVMFARWRDDDLLEVSGKHEGEWYTHIYRKSN